MKKQQGFVWLIGAGPGEPGLITVRGLEKLRQAQVVVYDALANRSLLAQASPDAELIDVGKRSNQHTLTQDQTNQLLVDKAKAGLRVARLKGGDPYLFGRGAEEAAYMAERGVACEVIPGVTSGIAAPAAAGIPVTHRQVASTLTFVTGHEDPTKDDSAINYASLAGLIGAGGTACFYMGVARLPLIVETLTKHGLSPTTPAALVQWGTLPRQRSCKTTLAKAVADVAAAGIGSPAIIVVGQVAGIDAKGLDYFTSRPLFGQRIVITRTRQQASDLRTQLEAIGAQVLEAPTIELQEPDDWQPTDDAIRNVGGYDWLVLTSSNGVDALARRMKVLGLDSRHLAGVKIAAIGVATADALAEQLRITPDLVPTRFVAESLAGELIAEHDIAGKKMLLLRADIARPALPRLLGEAGAEVTELVVYRTVLADGLPQDVLTALRNGQVDWVTFTSASTANNMVALLHSEKPLLDGVKICSIGPITSEAIQEQGLAVAVEAKQSDIPGLVQALVDAVQGV